MSSRITTTLLSFAIVLSLLGCASPINRKEADIHFTAAQQYDASGDYASARDQYWKALVSARLAGADRATISMLTYNFGRTSGYTCHIEEAEKFMIEALEMEKTITGPESGISTKRVFELARLYFDQGQFEKSAAYYAQGIPVVEKLGVAKSDPIALADTLDEYSIALNKNGQASLAYGC